MKNDHFFVSTRRGFFAAVGLGAAGLALRQARADVNEGAYEHLENGAGRFRIEIEGASVASANVESITIKDLDVDEHDSTPLGTAPEFRMFEPGDAHYGSITVRSRVGKESNELYHWWLDSSRGQNIRKTISVVCLKRDGTESRRWNLFDCFPVRAGSSRNDCTGTETSTVSARPERIELVSTDPEEAGIPSPRGCATPGDPVNGVVGRNPDVVSRGLFALRGVSWAAQIQDERLGASSWLPVVEFVPTDPVATDPTNPDVLRSIDAFHLRAPLTPGRKALCQWITSTVAGKPWRRTIVVKEILKDGSDGRSFHYLDCFPTRYVFPSFSSSGTGNLYEEVTIKPIRLELA